MTQRKQPEPKHDDGALADNELDGVSGGSLNGINRLVQVANLKADQSDDALLRPAPRPSEKKRN